MLYSPKSSYAMFEDCFTNPWGFVLVGLDQSWRVLPRLSYFPLGPFWPFCLGMEIMELNMLNGMTRCGGTFCACDFATSLCQSPSQVLMKKGSNIRTSGRGNLRLVLTFQPLKHLVCMGHTIKPKVSQVASACWHLWNFGRSICEKLHRRLDMKRFPRTPSVKSRLVGCWHPKVIRTKSKGNCKIRSWNLSFWNKYGNTAGN